MENFVTFLLKNAFVIIEEAGIKCFRNTKKAEEILVISDEKGVFLGIKN